MFVTAVCFLFLLHQVVTVVSIPRVLRGDWEVGTPLESWEVKLCRHVRPFSFFFGHLEISCSEVAATKKLAKWVDYTHQGKDAKRTESLE